MKSTPHNSLLIINCLFSLSLFAIHARGQEFYNQSSAYIKANSIWPCITDGTGLDFNTDPPGQALTYNSNWLYYGGEGFASVCDPVTGQLLFYSDGEQCFNASNAVMQNGDSLLGNSVTLSAPSSEFYYGFGGSTNQGVCIVPFVHQPGKYYLFSLNGPTNWLIGTPPASYCLYYSVIDMSLDGGLGGIVPGQKNIPLNSMNQLLGESMIAVPGNNCDIWLIVHDYVNPVFRSYHITGLGLDTNAVVSATGSQIQGLSGFGAYYTGSMAVSPSREYLAITSFNIGGVVDTSITGALLCRFDPSTGIVSDALRYGANINPIGVAFSPDNSKLYTSSTDGSTTQIFQFDISTFDAAAITATQQLIGTIGSYMSLSNLKSYNGKIYEGSTGDFLNVINQPDLPGAASDFQAADPDLPFLMPPFPNDVVFALPPDTASMREDTVICIKDSSYDNVNIPAPEGFYGYLWDDGSQDMTRDITNSGTYWVLCKDSCHSIRDTIVVRSINIPLDLGSDTVLCNGASLTWNITYPGSNYLWQDSSTNSNYTVIDSGTYWVQVTAPGCVLSDTVHISTIDVKQDLGTDVVLCKGEQLTTPLELHANVPPGAQVLWSNGSDDTLISATEAGNYWVTVTDSICTGSDTLSVIEQLCNCWADIPSAFSPNGDGLNDVFQPVIEAGCPIQNYMLNIYNRYGTRIFSGYNPGEGWNGTYSNGKPADVGVYMYTLSFEGGTNKNMYKKKGDISLVR